MEKAEENYKVPNLEKGIAVLEYLSLYSLGRTLQAIKSELDISQTTAYRILNTLVRLGYLYIMKIQSIINYPANYYRSDSNH